MLCAVLSGGSIVSGKHNSPTLHRKCCSFSSGCHYNIVLLMGMLCLIDAYIFIMYIRMLLTTTPLRNDYCHWSSDYYFVVHMTFQVNHI